MAHTTQPPTPAPSLSDVAQLVSLSISVAPKRIERRDVSADVATRAGAENRRAVRTTVDLIPPGVLTVDADPWRHATAARQDHYRMTLPYGSVRGVHLLPAALLVDYSRTMSDHRVRFGAAVSRLCERWADVRDEARRVHGALFREADYPTADEIRGRFGLSFDRSPLPTGSNALSTLADPLADRLREHWEGKIRADVAASQAEALTRAADALSHVADKLHAYDPENPKRAPWRDSTIRAIYDAADLLPAFNVLSCPDTADVAARLRALVDLADTPADLSGMLRESTSARALAEDEAREAAEIARAAAERHRTAPTAEPTTTTEGSAADLYDAADALASL